MLAVRRVSRVAIVATTLAAFLGLAAPAQADPVSDAVSGLVSQVQGVPLCC